MGPGVGEGSRPFEECGLFDVRPLVLVASVVALGCTFSDPGRAWTVFRLHHAPAPPWPPSGYRQQGMPWGFWLAAVLVATMALVLDVSFVAVLFGGGQGAGPWGAAFWSGVFAIIVSRYGFRSAGSRFLEARLIGKVGRRDHPRGG